MRCRACRHDNPADAVFCAGCGARLMLVCAGCRRPNATDARFCNGCGRALEDAPPPPRTLPPPPPHLAERILTSRAALEGERKQVTVLFADVKGSMGLASKVDPEERHKIMDAKSENPRRRSVVREDAEHWCDRRKALSDEDVEELMRSTLGFWE